MNDNEILIYAELSANNCVAPVVFELIGAAHKLSEKISNCKIALALLGNFASDYQIYKDIFGKVGVDKIFVVDDQKLSNYSSKLFAYSILEIVEQAKPSIFLIGATILGRDLAPIISTRLKTGLTADCTKLDINEKGLLAATRPTFGGNLMATILSKKSPQMATVRPNVFQRNQEVFDKVPEMIVKNVDLKNLYDPVKLISQETVLYDIKNNLTDAKFIIAGGKGMKSKDGFLLLEKLASQMDASVGATRGAVDIGLAPSTIQIGQTGKTVMPVVYLACGISGAIQHTVGMNSSEVIIAINSDSKAKIFEIADYCIVADVFDILPKWIELLKNK